MRFETKIAIVVRTDLARWQQVNMTAFLASGIAGGRADVLGEPYEDESGARYLAMFRQPVLCFGGTGEDLRRVRERASSRGLGVAVFTDELFATGHDEANRAAVRAVPTEKLSLAGLGLHGRRTDVDKAVKGLALLP